jgi:hypothetical protein
MKTTKLIAAFTAVVLIATEAYSQFRPVEPIRPIEPIRVPTLPDLRPLPDLKPLPSFSAAPSLSVSPSKPAEIENIKLQKAVSQRIFEYQMVTLTSTSRVTTWDDGNYAAGAYFSVQDESVRIQCVSTVRAVVVAFLEYIRSLFSDDGASASSSLDQIARDAHRYLRNHGFSDGDITLNYIDQFNKTHVVQISRRKLEIMLASR